MQRAYARISLPSGETADLCPGDLIGRLWSAALRLDDERISEVHAMVSLRGGQLKLLALRGMLAADGRRTADVVLRPGQEVALSDEMGLAGEAVEVPDRVLALGGLGLGGAVWARGAAEQAALARLQARAAELGLTASVYSLVADPSWVLMPRYRPGALAYIWTTGAAWHARVGQGGPTVLEAGGRLEIDGRSLEVVAVDLAQAGTGDTRWRGRLHPPVRIVNRYDTVEVHQPGRPALSLSGLSARILSELLAASCAPPASVRT